MLSCGHDAISPRVNVIAKVDVRVANSLKKAWVESIVRSTDALQEYLSLCYGDCCCFSSMSSTRCCSARLHFIQWHSFRLLEGLSFFNLTYRSISNADFPVGQYAFWMAVVLVMQIWRFLLPTWKTVSVKPGFFGVFQSVPVQYRCGSDFYYQVVAMKHSGQQIEAGKRVNGNETLVSLSTAWLQAHDVESLAVIACNDQGASSENYSSLIVSSAALADSIQHYSTQSVCVWNVRRLFILCSFNPFTVLDMKLWSTYFIKCLCVMSNWKIPDVLRYSVERF